MPFLRMCIPCRRVWRRWAICAVDCCHRDGRCRNLGRHLYHAWLVYRVRREHRHWLRETRRAADAAWSAAFTEVEIREFLRPYGGKAEAQDLVNEMVAAFGEFFGAWGAVDIAGPPAVADAATRMKTALMKKDDAAG